MENLDQIATIIAMTMGVAWASGINLYATILVLGFLGASGHMVLPPDLMILTDPLILFAAGAMYLVEFFADKVPHHAEVVAAFCRLRGIPVPAAEGVAR